MRITVLGLGRMGQALAGRLLGAGHDVTIWNRSPGRTSELVAAGAVAAGSIPEAIGGAELVLTSLADDDAVRAVALGGEGVRSSLSPDTPYADTSTVSPQLSDELEQTFPRFAAMPILGAPSAVADGQAAYLLGGSADVAAVLDTVLPSLTEKVRRYPTARLASTAKVTSNLLLLIGVAGLAEALTVGRRGGLTDDQLTELLGESPLVAPGIRNRFEAVLTGTHDPWWSAALGAKDVRLAMDVARRADTELPVAGAVHERYAKLAANFDADDIAEISKLYDGRSG